MRNSIYGLLLLLAGLLTGTNVLAQNNETVEDVMRSNGKIYVVLAICLTILVGLFIYLFSIDKKIRKIEDKQ